MYQQGTRVNTPSGVGTVQYVRMVPPAYASVEAVSVRLDVKADRPGYTASMFPADRVWPYRSVVEE